MFYFWRDQFWARTLFCFSRIGRMVDFCEINSEPGYSDAFSWAALVMNPIWTRLFGWSISDKINSDHKFQTVFGYCAGSKLLYYSELGTLTQTSSQARTRFKFWYSVPLGSKFSFTINQISCLSSICLLLGLWTMIVTWLTVWPSGNSSSRNLGCRLLYLQ